MLIDPATLATFLAASVALYLTPGADMMFISASGVAGGRRTGLMAGLGVSIGTLASTFSHPLRRAGRMLNPISSIVFGGLAAKLVFN